MKYWRILEIKKTPVSLNSGIFWNKEWQKLHSFANLRFAKCAVSILGIG